MIKHLRLATLAVTIGSGTCLADACSVCIAHALGAGLRAVGSQTLPKGKVVAGISYLTFSKSQDGDEPGTSENHRQSEAALDLFYGLNNQWMLHLNVPYDARSLSATWEEKVSTQGVGDVTLGVTYQVKPRLNDKVLIAFTGDLKLPSGDNKIRNRNGDLEEEHVQIGTGSTDFALGVVATTELGGGIGFAGLKARFNGRNDRGFHYGDALFYNLGYSMPIGATSSLVLEFNGRFAGKDRLEDGGLDDNSGGHMGYLSLNFRQSLTKNSGLIIGYELPVLRNLHGSQSEGGIFTIGVSVMF